MSFAVVPRSVVHDHNASELSILKCFDSFARVEGVPGSSTDWNLLQQLLPWVWRDLDERESLLRVHVEHAHPAQKESKK